MDKIIRSVFPHPTAGSGGGSDANISELKSTGDFVITIDRGPFPIYKDTPVFCVDRKAFPFRNYLKRTLTNDSNFIDFMPDVYEFVETWDFKHYIVYKNIGDQKLKLYNLSDYTHKTIINSGFLSNTLSVDIVSYGDTAIAAYSQSGKLTLQKFNIHTGTIIGNAIQTSENLPISGFVWNEYMTDIFQVIVFYNGADLKAISINTDTMTILHTMTIASATAPRGMPYLVQYSNTNLYMLWQNDTNGNIIGTTISYNDSFTSGSKSDTTLISSISGTAPLTCAVDFDLGHVFVAYRNEPNKITVQRVIGGNTFSFQITAMDTVGSLMLNVNKDIIRVLYHRPDLNAGVCKIYKLSDRSLVSTTVGSYNIQNLSRFICYTFGLTFQVMLASDVSNNLYLLMFLDLYPNYDAIVGLALNDANDTTKKEQVKVMIEGVKLKPDYLTINSANTIKVPIYAQATTGVLTTVPSNAKYIGYTMGYYDLRLIERAVETTLTISENLYDILEEEKRSPTYAEAVAYNIWNNRVVYTSGSSFVVPNNVYYIGIAVVSAGRIDGNGCAAVKFRKVTPGETINFTITSTGAFCDGMSAPDPNSSPSGGFHQFSAGGKAANWILQHGPSTSEALRGSYHFYTNDTSESAQSIYNRFILMPLGFVTRNDLNGAPHGNNWSRGGDWPGFGGRGEDKDPLQQSLSGPYYGRNGGFGARGGNVRLEGWRRYIEYYGWAECTIYNGGSLYAGNGGFGACGGRATYIHAQDVSNNYPANCVIKGGDGGIAGGGGGSAYAYDQKTFTQKPSVNGTPGGPAVVFIY